MKKVSANYIFPGNSAPIKNGVVVINSNGEILDLLNPEADKINWDTVEIHEGVICPGFVNTHCHLELSHLKGKLAENTQLDGFVKEIMSIRDHFTDEERKEAISKAEKEMLRNGIVAIGDIANGNSTFNQKEKSTLKYHTFLEVFSLDPNAVEEIIDRTSSLKKEYFNSNRISITPHAPYSMSEKLVEKVNAISRGIITIHNQETASENELFSAKSGKLYNQLVSINALIKDWTPTCKNSLPSYLTNYDSSKKTLLVHNTFTNKEDVEFANNYSENIYWCFCPNANQYIEGKQPDYTLFLNEKCTIGTDSLASNWSLSILDELKTIAEKDPSIPLDLLIKWATFNGAEFLGFEELGVIEKGTSPGLNLISEVKNLKLTKESTVKKII